LSEGQRGARVAGPGSRADHAAILGAAAAPRRLAQTADLIDIKTRALRRCQTGRNLRTLNTLNTLNRLAWP
jgi:hypothetical protein